MGIADYPLNEDLQRFLQNAVHREPSLVQTGQGSGVATPALRVPPVEGISAPEVLVALQHEIGQCTLCRLAAGSQGRVPGQGRSGSPLMVVGDWSAQGQGCNPAILFGAEEDVMLWKMMEAIGLRQEGVYVTNILKCCPGGEGAEQECWQDCFSFLLREIGAVQPRMICAMGELAVRMLVGGTEPLFRLRGRFTVCRYQSAPPIPVMPTFHPRYLLRNPEMKMATWKDLQAMQKRLGQPGKAKG